LWPSLTNARWTVIHIMEQAQGLTPFIPHHTSPPCMETQNTPTFIPNHPTTHPHRNTMQCATTCKATNMQQYNLWTQRREMGTGHREGVGPTTTMSCSTHQWVHWCACLTSKDQLSSISPSPSIAWHRWCCTCRPLGNPLTHRNPCQNPQKPILVSTSTGTTKSTWGLPMPILQTRWNRVTIVNDQGCWLDNWYKEEAKMAEMQHNKKCISIVES